MVFLIALLIIAVLWPNVARNIIYGIGLIFMTFIAMGIIGTIIG